MLMIAKIWTLFLVILFSAGCASTQVRFAAMGDTPYYADDIALLAISDVLNVMYKEEIPFVVHVGDIMRDGTSCSDEMFKRRADVFSSSPIPFLITIGDNEFNDCKDPVKARKRFQRIILNNPPVSQEITGIKESSGSIHVIRQPELIENAAWRYNGVDFIMLVLPDFPGNYRLKTSYTNKLIDLNIKFLISNFKKAKNNNSHAVVVIMHANPITCLIKACALFLKKLKDEISKFEKPVLLLNGSVHEQIFEGPGYLELPNLWHLRPGSEPEESWPEVIFSKQSKLFSVKFHNVDNE